MIVKKIKKYSSPEIPLNFKLNAELSIITIQIFGTSFSTGIFDMFSKRILREKFK